MTPTSLWTTWYHHAASHRPALACIEPRDKPYFCAQGELLAQTEHAARSVPDGFLSGQVVAFSETLGLRWLVNFLGFQQLGAVVLSLDNALPPAQRPAAATAFGAHWLVTHSLQPFSVWTWQRLPTNSAPLEGDHCLIKTTSGSTGQPRPLAFTGAQMLADGRQIAATMGIGPDDLNLGAIPFGHSYGLGNLVLPLIAQGTAVIASNEILPDALATQIERFGATVLPSVPAVLRALAESSVDPARLRSLRRVISAGAPLRPEIARAFQAKFGLPIHNFYGSSETGGICFDRTGEATLSGRSVGHPLDGVSVSLNEDGQVTVRSPAVVAPGEHTLADLGTFTADGELALAGRATPLANIGGKKVSPLEIERILRALDGVSDAWVGVATRTAGEGDFLLAAVETASSLAEIRSLLAERLPVWQVPRRLWVTPHFPRTARGKLDRQELEAHCLA